MTATFNFHTIKAAPMNKERIATTLSADDDGRIGENDPDLLIIYRNRTGCLRFIRVL
jgi:hypothetical protein